MKKLLYSLLFIIPFTSFSQNLLKNIASSDASADITEFTEFMPNTTVKGDSLFFMATDTLYSYSASLWFTCNSTGLTKRVTNINDNNQVGFYKVLGTLKDNILYQVGSSGNSYLYATNGNTVSLISNLGTSNYIETGGVIGNWLYLFVSTNNRSKLELWKTDGISTILKVTDIVSGSYNLNYYNDNSLLVTGDKIYFALYSSSYGTEPWVTDGTAAGTFLLKDITPGTSSSNPYAFEKLGSNILFYANDINYSRKLWKTDGTTAGTTLLTTSINGNTNYGPYMHKVYHNKFYFVANYNKIYRTDGNSIELVQTGVAPTSNFMTTNDNLFFINQSGYDYELWKHNDITAETKKIKKLITSYNYIESRVYSGQTKCYFELFRFSNYTFENILQHWVSDGTDTGTQRITDLNTNLTVGTHTTPIRVVEDVYYFTGYDAVNGFELWKTDGTSGGTSIVKNINKSLGSSDPFMFVGISNAVFFVANDIKYGKEIWKTDGTGENTQLYVDYNSNSTVGVSYSSDISGMAELNNVIIAQIALNLVKIDGKNPPAIISSINLVNPSNPEFFKFNNKLFYKGYSSDYGYELWVTDGSTASMVKDLTVGYSDSSPTSFVIANGMLYFKTNSGTKLWKTDGTAGGTILVKQWSLGSMQTSLVEAGGKVFFGFQDSVYGYELWVSDGTTAGTNIVRDLFVGSNSSNISNLVAYNGNIYFTAYNGSTSGVWKSDGTYGGTIFIHNVILISNPKVFKNKLFYLGYDLGSNTYALFSTQGTTATKIKTVSQSLISSGIKFANIDDKYLVFDILPSTSKHELWISDGTETETKLVKTLRNVTISLYYNSIKEYFYHNKKLYFAANDGIVGNELWMWDFGCQELLTLTNPVNLSSNFAANKYIVGSNIIDNNAIVKYNANNYVALEPGFEVRAGSIFSTEMIGCATSSPVLSSNKAALVKNTGKESNLPSIEKFLKEPTNDELSSAFHHELSRNNQQNIAWIIEEQTDKYVLKMRVDEKEYIGSLLK